MSYFTAVLTSDGDGWHSVDLDVEDAVDVEELADEVRAAIDDSGETPGPVLVVLEREDEWFALVRVDGEEPRAFVSDLPAASSSHYGELLSVTADSPAPQPAPQEDEEEDSAARVAAPTWAGDADLLADLGLAGGELADTAESRDPAGALVAVGEKIGFVDLLEALR
ncbi:putative tRNA adenosine deaminase-associated protein [Quadrisphaera granulorum]|uniref:Putative tRNA adenosine deaminase-associated protein n=1 Tax=Quadrisphaera granulorum TaxID=317664 RepID=A0A316A3Z9_9ACTN|nr:tRNA adenosine deaminase-associated protein [Quadrisphaera granulorum]PWJ52706.1 putative tRNA adenosine deaminase-associated protein [Quadrisphaera granulorum]SZE97528.1 putative tRNA adenosine deaminase-associated protein [Quadrisphaera granulorum]